MESGFLAYIAALSIPVKKQQIPFLQISCLHKITCINCDTRWLGTQYKIVLNQVTLHS